MAKIGMEGRREICVKEKVTMKSLSNLAQGHHGNTVDRRDYARRLRVKESSANRKEVLLFSKRGTCNNCQREETQKQGSGIIAQTR